MTKLVRLVCGTGPDITDEDNYWIETDATDDDLERPVAVTVLIHKGTPLPVAATLVGMAEEMLLSEAIHEDETETDTHIGAN